MKSQWRKIVTNNERVRDWQGFGPDDEFIDGTASQVITRCRDLVHLGWVLVTHPMASSLKPGENPFRTVIVEKGDVLDVKSLYIIESAIESALKFDDGWSMLLDVDGLDERLKRIRDDFLTIDMGLIITTH